MDWNLLEVQLETKLHEVCSQIVKQTIEQLKPSYQSNPNVGPNYERESIQRQQEGKKKTLHSNGIELAIEWKKLNDAKDELQRICKMQDSQINLDIGGKYFSTSMETLTKDANSMLGSMFSGRYPIKKNDQGRVFIDRDGSVFDIILEYLRDGEFVIPKDEITLQKLVREVRYYGLREMEVILNGNNDNSNDNEKSTMKKNAPSSIYVIGGTTRSGKTNQVNLYCMEDKQWVACPAMNKPRFSHAAASYKGKIYVAGGASLEDGRTGEMFDPEKGFWRSIALMNYGRAKFRLVTMADKIYSVDSTMEYYDPVADLWKSVQAKSPGTEIYGATAWNDNLLVSTGTEIKLFDPRAGTWSVVASWSCREKGASTKYHQIAAIGDKVFVLGGFDSGFQSLDTVKCVDMRHNTWSTAQPMMKPRHSHYSVVCDGKIVVLDDGQTAEMYDPDANEWSRLQDTPENRYSFAVAAV